MEILLLKRDIVRNFIFIHKVTNNVTLDLGTSSVLKSEEIRLRSSEAKLFTHHPCMSPGYSMYSTVSVQCTVYSPV